MQDVLLISHGVDATLLTLSRLLTINANAGLAQQRGGLLSNVKQLERLLRRCGQSIFLLLSCRTRHLSLILTCLILLSELLDTLE